jgi:hypothetical protein
LPVDSLVDIPHRISLEELKVLVFNFFV